MTGQRRYSIAPSVWLEVAPRGLTGAFGLACALGLNVLPMNLDSALDRAEWVDIVAKTRGMYHTNPDLLYRFAVVRQFCGCRCTFDPTPDHGLIMARFVVRLCAGHPWEAPQSDDERIREILPEPGVIALGILSASTP